MSPAHVSQREQWPGARIDHRLSWHGVPLRWRAEIIRWEPRHERIGERFGGPAAEMGGNPA